ncbi:hypothetical protein F5Y03DRAFT_175326 [Xylaria venustula]|nr:hypothetical protein F5Y03DRAFT_175326 [Xylaria venustula]
MSFPKLTCLQCTRRLSRLSQLFEPQNNPALGQAATPRHLSHNRNPLFTTRHHYSTERRARRQGSRDAFSKVRFTRADVPTLEFWELQARAPLVTDLSPEECQRAVQAYTDAAMKNTPQWRERLIAVVDPQSRNGGTKGNAPPPLSAYTLHYAAWMMATDPTRTIGAAGHLAMHILHTLSSLGYTPSILTMVRLALTRNLLGQPQFEPVVEGLERILRRVGDGRSGSKSVVSKENRSDFAADACTLRALIYEKENTREGDNNALRWFRRAYELGQPTTAGDPVDEPGRGKEGEGVASTRTETAPFNPSWQWKASFALGVGRIRANRGEMEKARDMYAIAASELDNAEGYWLLADVLEKMGETGSEQYAQSLEKAAISGNRNAARKVASREWDRAVEPGLNRWEKRKRQIVAEEWMAVSGATAPAQV